MSIQPCRHSMGGAVAPAACEKSAVTLVIEHHDTIGRALPEGLTVRVTDANGGTHQATLDSQGRAEFTEIPAGELSWAIEALDWHLVAVDDEPAPVPRATVPEPLPSDVAPKTARIHATYLPQPILVNLREEADPEEGLLSEEAIELLREQGNNATLFIHGYNVPLGRYGDYVVDESWSRNPRSGEQYDPRPVWKGQPEVSVFRDPEQAPEGFQLDRLPDAPLNGEGALNWGIHMEYRFNRAAGMPVYDWRDYARIINVTWSGDAGVTDFFQAELNAMQAGRRLVRVLRQLKQAGIAVNVITHSLGARVALAALNVLGENGSSASVDHLFLWQPAVADNALTNKAENDWHPLRMGVFPRAHRGARRIVVLYSKRDGVLGASRFTFVGDSKTDNLYGQLGALYPKKWWTFPSFLDNGLGVPLKTYYEQRGYGSLSHVPEPSWAQSQVHHGDRPGKTAEARYEDQRRRHEQSRANWQRLKDDMLAEAERLFDQEVDFLKEDQAPPDYDLLAPLAHHAVINQDRALEFHQRLEELAEQAWRADKDPLLADQGGPDRYALNDETLLPRFKRRPRPAMGYVGFERLIGDGASQQRDQFLENEAGKNNIALVNQTAWLFSHSGMKIPSDAVFENSFIDAIMEPIMTKGAGFGRY